jgi:hypothetical protein
VWMSQEREISNVGYRTRDGTGTSVHRAVSEAARRRVKWSHWATYADRGLPIGRTWVRH